MTGLPVILLEWQCCLHSNQCELIDDNMTIDNKKKDNTFYFWTGDVSIVLRSLSVESKFTLDLTHKKMIDHFLMIMIMPLVVIMSSLRYRFPLDHKNLMFMVLIMITFVIVMSLVVTCLNGARNDIKVKELNRLDRAVCLNWAFSQ